jgi:hypothetical protein
VLASELTLVVPWFAAVPFILFLVGWGFFSRPAAIRYRARQRRKRQTQKRLGLR